MSGAKLQIHYGKGLVRPETIPSSRKLRLVFEFHRRDEDRAYTRRGEIAANSTYDTAGIAYLAKEYLDRYAFTSYGHAAVRCEAYVEDGLTKRRLGHICTAVLGENVIIHEDGLVEELAESESLDAAMFDLATLSALAF